MVTDAQCREKLLWRALIAALFYGHNSYLERVLMDLSCPLANQQQPSTRAYDSQPLACDQLCIIRYVHRIGLPVNQDHISFESGCLSVWQPCCYCTKGLNLYCTCSLQLSKTVGDNPPWKPAYLFALWGWASRKKCHHCSNSMLYVLWPKHVALSASGSYQ